MSLINSFLIVATSAARPHTDSELDLARVLTATALAFTYAGWKLPGLLAATPDLVESLRVTSSGKSSVFDADGQAS